MQGNVHTLRAREGWIEAFSARPPVKGEAELLLFGPDTDLRHASAFGAYALAGMTEEGSYYFPRLFAVLPPTADCAALGEELTRQVAAHFGRMSAQSAEELLRVARSRVGVRQAASFDLGALSEAVAAVEPGSVVWISALIRYTGHPLPPVGRAIGPETPHGDQLRLATDAERWLPHVTETCRRLLCIAQERELFLLLWADCFQPADERLCTALCAIDAAVGVRGATRVGDPEPLADQALPRWVSEVRAGREEEVFAELADLDAPPITRELLKVQVLTLAGRPLAAFQLAEPHLPKVLASGQAKVQLGLARAAFDAGRETAARSLLEAALASGLLDEPVLRFAAQLAERLEARELRRELHERLIRLHPNATSTVELDVRKLLASGDHAGIVARLESLAGPELDPRLAFCLRLAREQVDAAGDPERAFRELSADDPVRSFATVCTARALSAAGRSTVAFAVLRDVELEPVHREAGLDAALQIVRDLLLAVPTEEEQDPLAGPLQYLFRAQAERHDGERRVELARLLSPSNAGLRGDVALVSLVRAAEPPAAREGDPPEIPTVEPERVMAWIQDALERLPEQLLLGVGAPPSGPSPDDAALLEGLVLLVEAVCQGPMDEATLELLPRVLHVGLLLANGLADTLRDLELIRLVAGAAARSHRKQLARDLAECCLGRVRPGDAPARRRFAWQTFADIYLRGQNPREALLAIACSFACPVEGLRPAFAVAERQLLARTLRALGRWSDARAVLREARERFAEEGCVPRHMQRLRELELSNDMAESLARPDAPRSGDLIKRLVAAGHEALAQGEVLLPYAVMLAQLVERPEGVAEARAEAAQALEVWLDTLDPAQVEMVRAFAARSPSRAQVEAVARVHARNAEDLAFDLAPARVLARRLLRAAAERGEAADALFALEVLCEQGFSLPGTAETGPGDDVPSAVRRWAAQGHDEAATSPETLAWLAGKGGDRPTQGAAVLADDIGRVMATLEPDLSLHVVGLDADSRLIRLSASAGRFAAPVVEPADVFSAGAYRDWRRRRFPAAYGKLAQNAGPQAHALFSESVRGLGLSVTPSDKCTTLLVPTERLRSLPANLLRSGEHLFGDLAPIAIAPSLAWLNAARHAPRAATGRRIAWLFPGHYTGALGILHGAFAEACQPRDVALSVSKRAPSGLPGADLALVGAHGGLSEGRGFFRMVEDEDEGRLQAREFVSRLADCGVVVLFVCSAGRSDPDPHGGPVVGLPSLLLEAGCRAVVAPPWPLDAVSAYDWLPAFLDAYLGGATVARAVFQANEAERDACGRDPARYLAMHLIGDPSYTLR